MLTTPQVRLDGNLEVLFSDTVGFIQKLPTQLVAAFRATLEEIAAASVVLHVLDVSAPNAAAQCAAVLQVMMIWCRREGRPTWSYDWYRLPCYVNDKMTVQVDSFRFYFHCRCNR
jgi:hypothetical protein